MATIPKSSWVSSTALAVSTTHTWFIWEINFIGEFYDIVLIMRYLANTVTGLAFSVDDFKMSELRNKLKHEWKKHDHWSACEMWQ